jgi:NAD(P)-dependent dehydrogenase (short-subunit alcohol dehydrogenase family)
MNILIFGGTGSLGAETVEHLRRRGHRVLIASRQKPISDQVHISESFEELQQIKIQFDGVAWFQGSNINDTLDTSTKFLEIFEANVNFIIKSQSALLKFNLLTKQARLLIVSSIWQRLSRKNKFSYTVSKSAISGIVKSVTADYGSQGITINAILPGVIENEMTIKNLSQNQIQKIESETPLRKLVTPKEIASIAAWLLSPDSSGIAGQSIVIDNGWSDIRDI